MKYSRLLIISAFIIAVSGCAFNPQQASLNPTLNIASSNIGSNSNVYIEVLDERSSKSLGRRGTAYGSAAEITSKEELSAVVKREIQKGLITKGFAITDRASANTVLIVEVRDLNYTTSQGFWTGGVHIKGAFKGRAKNLVSEMEKMYRYEKEERIMIIPTAETNEKWINEALTATLNKLLGDAELMQFLAKKA